MKSALTEDLDHCIFCGRKREAMHHIFPGSRRSTSDRYGYIVPLCMECHTASPESVHILPNQGKDLYLKKIAQEHFESHHGDRNVFRELFLKSYL